MPAWILKAPAMPKPWRRTWVNLPNGRQHRDGQGGRRHHHRPGVCRAAKDPDLSAVKINVDTPSKRCCHPNGPAPNPAAKDRAQTIAKSIKGHWVTNLLVISGG